MNGDLFSGTVFAMTDAERECQRQIGEAATNYYLTKHAGQKAYWHSELVRLRARRAEIRRLTEEGKFFP